MVFIELIAGFSAQIPTRQQNILVTRRELVTGELKFLGILSDKFSKVGCILPMVVV